MKKLFFAFFLLLLAPGWFNETHAQIITTLAGNITAADRLRARDTQLVSCRAVAVDADGAIYIADDGSRTVRRIDPATGIATVIAGGGALSDDLVPIPATSAYLNLPGALAVGPGKRIYIADDANHRIRRVDANGLITTVAGNGMPGFSGDGGPAVWALLADPRSIAVDSAGNLYITDTGANAVRKVEANTGVIRTLAGGPGSRTGDGIPAAEARLQVPSGMAVDANGNVFFAETERHVVRKIEAATGLIRTVAGSGTAGLSGDGGPATAAALMYPITLAVAPNGDLFIGHEARVRKVAAAGGTISTVVGGGALALADGRAGTSVALTGDIGQLSFVSPGTLLIAFPVYDQIGQLNLATGILSIVAGNSLIVGDGGPAKTAAVSGPRKLALDTAGNLYIAGVSAQLNFPTDLVLDGRGGLLIADQENSRVRRLDLASGNIATIAGNGTFAFSGDGGPAPMAGIPGPSGLAMDPRGNLYVTAGHALRRIDAATGKVTSVAGGMDAGFSGDEGLAFLARLRGPRAVAVDAAGNLILSDSSNHRVRRISAGQVVPDLVVTPSALNFASVAGGHFPPPQIVQITTRNMAPAPWSASARLDNGSGWLTFVPPRGGTPGILEVLVDASALTPGTYTATITISAPEATNSTQTVRVTFTVEAGGRPRLVVDRPNLTFHAVAGGSSPPPQAVQLFNAGGGQLEWSSIVQMRGGGTWLSVSPSSGAGPATLIVTATVGSLASGVYPGLVALINNPGGEMVEVLITLVVSPAAASLVLSHFGSWFSVNEGASSAPADTVQVV